MNPQEVLRDFLPDRLFDAHTHPYDSRFTPRLHPPGVPAARYTLEDYRRDMDRMLGFSRAYTLNMITYPDDQRMADESTGLLRASDEFLVGELEKDRAYVGEILVTPQETAAHIAARLTHPGIRGLKCYHTLHPARETFQLDIGEFLPEAAWEVAQKRHMVITLHMVKDDALADPENLRYIRTMARRHPDAVLILAHAARAFAAWTGVESVEKVADLDNVFFDFAAVCESPAMVQIFRKTGTKRCLWGSDYPISNQNGKAISLADTFYWLYDAEYAALPAAPRPWPIGIENLMAVRQACILAGLSDDQVEDVFYNNAAALFGRA